MEDENSEEGFRGFLECHVDEGIEAFPIVWPEIESGLLAREADRWSSCRGIHLEDMDTDKIFRINSCDWSASMVIAPVVSICY